jgi:hypothetical protein
MGQNPTAWMILVSRAITGQIARALGSTSQQTVSITTQELAGRRVIRSAKEGAAHRAKNAA